VGLVVFGLTTLLETLVDNFGHNWTVGWVIAIDVLAFAADLLGEIFFVGLLDRLVGETAHGHAHQSVPTVLRTLRYGPLILADVLAVAIVILGLFVLVVPGVVLFTLLCLSGPILNIEGLSAVGALRRSAQLVRRRFWLTVVMVTVPFFAADTVASSVQDAAHGLPVAADFVIHAVLATAIAIVTGLVQVELAHRFIEADRQGQAASDGRLV
jgi:uncharacterized membrane protein HdeD (DUF308 family)